MKVLVTGSSGFIGSHLVRRLEARGDEVVGWDCMEVTARCRAYYPAFDLYFRTPELVDRLRRAVAGVHQVYHLAGNADVAAYDLYPDLMAREWVMAATVIGACMDAGKPLMVASSAYALGENTQYGRTKKGIEQMCELAAGAGASPVSVARVFNIYGPGQEKAVTYNSAVVLNLYRAFKKGEWSLKHPTAVRDFVYIQDAIEMLVHVMAKTISDRPRSVAEICSGGMTTVGELGSIMAGIMQHPEPLGLPAVVESEEAPYRIAGFPVRVAQVPLREGLRRTIAHLEETAA